MIAISKLQKSIGARVLFANASFYLNAGRRYGLVGANGSGKSTLMRILAGEDEATDGNIAYQKGAKLGFLRQDQFFADQDIILHAAMKGQKEAAAAYFALENAHELTLEEQSHHQETLLRLDGYALPAKAAEILEGLGIESSYHAKPLSALSGGYKWRVLLAQVLIANPDVLLLDEPTNHLDIVTIRWLEKFLTTYEGCAVIISHDRRFLDNVCTDTLDVDYATITQYAGNYSQFEGQKKLKYDQLEAEIAGQQREIAHKMAFVERFGAKATKAKQAQSRLKQVERIEVKELPQSSRRYLSLQFKPKRPSGKEVLTLEHISKAFGPKQVLTDVNFQVLRGQKLAIIGPNGMGKSTLLKVIMGQLEQERGRYVWGHEAQIAYFAQDHEAAIADKSMTLEEWLWQFCPSESKGFVRSYLGRVLFSGEEAEKKVGHLSGGETARLVLAQLMLQCPNVLILDEPTNHLDMEAVESLVAALKAYEGTLLFVSHDRWFVSQLANRIIELKPVGLQDFPGTYEEYLAKSGDDHLDAQAVSKMGKDKQPASPVNAKAYQQESKEKKAQAKKQQQAYEAMLKEIEEIEHAISRIDAQLVDEHFYQSATGAQLKELQDKREALEERLEVLYATH